MSTWFLPAVQRKIILIFCALLGLALQIQATFGFSESYNGIRVNLGDLFLPFAGLFILAALILKQADWPQWRLRFGILWPIALTAVMAFALLNGYIQSHELSHWALYNKFTGWLVLVGYFLLGAWIVTNAGDESVKIFIRTFAVSFAAITVINLLWLFLRDITTDHFSLIYIIQLKGLMGNRNAYALLIVTVLAIITVWQMAGRGLLPPYAYSLFWFLMPGIMVYNGSRAGCIAVVFLTICFTVFYRTKFIKNSLVPFALCGLLVGWAYSINPQFIMRENQNYAAEYLLQSAKNGRLNYEGYAEVTDTRTGDMMRLRVLKDSLALWQKSPVSGIGLGSFIRFQVSHYPDKDSSLFIIDCTPLWILVEMGIVGALVFSGFALFALPSIVKGSLDTSSEANLLRRSLLLTLIGFCMMMMFHELLYSRYLWFILGLALANPKEKAEIA